MDASTHENTSGSMDEIPPAPIVLAAPPMPAALLGQILARVDGIVAADDAFEALLAAHAGDGGRIPADAATPAVIAAIRDAAAKLSGRRRLLLAAPENLLRVGFLHRIFPEAVFVWIFREAVRTIYDPRDTSGRPPAERARDWNAATTMLLDDLERLPGSAWTGVPYRLIAQYPDQALNGMTAFLGVKWDGVLPPHRDDPFLERDQMPDLATVEELTAKVSARARELFGRAAAQARLRERPAASNEEARATAFRAVATQSFGPLLRGLGLSLVVSTYQSGCLILIHAEESGAVGTEVRMFRSPMGIAVRKGEMALGTKTDLWHFRNVPAIAQRIEPAGRYDACFLPRRLDVTGDIRVHEIGFAGDELWLVNTRFSVLCTIDGQSSFVPRWRPPFVSRLEGEDRCHLNGMTILDGRVRYVSALGTSDTAGGWRATRSDGGVLVDVDSGEIVLRGLSMPHSPRQHDGRFYILESGKGTIARADLASGRVETVTELPGFTRGLSFAGPYAFIGLSQVRESNIFGGIPLLDRVEERQCGIYVVDLRDGELVAFLRFEGSVHEIFDVQVLHGIRRPYIADLTDKLVVSSFAVPNEVLPDFA
jgi:uncharacterized protein (TIGR03032 family)